MGCPPRSSESSGGSGLSSRFKRRKSSVLLAGLRERSSLSKNLANALLGTHWFRVESAQLLAVQPRSFHLSRLTGHDAQPTLFTPHDEANHKREDQLELDSRLRGHAAILSPHRPELYALPKGRQGKRKRPEGSRYFSGGDEYPEWITKPNGKFRSTSRADHASTSGQPAAGKERIDTSGEAMAKERNPAANAAKRPKGDHASTSRQPARTASTKDTTNLLAVLDIVQQVGDIFEKVPFVAPIGAILSHAIKVYKEVDNNSGKWDALSAKATALDDGIKEAIRLLEKSDNLESDVEDYGKKLEEVRAVLTVHRGKFSQVIQRGKLAAELTFLDRSLNDFSKLFETKVLDKN
ncbi:hypothetical protein C8J57DRAFT_212582 [Mycena rebaudengoi]|nr:hypothetical protein C8J57DRAFT_212582 [Mycena rebaudengoi]